MLTSGPPSFFRPPFGLQAHFSDSSLSGAGPSGVPKYHRPLPAPPRSSIVYVTTRSATWSARVLQATDAHQLMLQYMACSSV